MRTVRFAAVFATAMMVAACAADAEAGKAATADQKPVGQAISGGERPKKKISPEKLRETIRKVTAQKTGGIVRAAGSAKGMFVVLNAQRIVPAESLAPAIGTLDSLIHVQAKVVPAEADRISAKDIKEAISAAGGVLGVALVEGDGASLLVAPEDGWAIINVSVLAKDGADAATLAARVRKETLRGFAFVSGGAYMARAEPLMRNVRSVRDLDAVALEHFGVEAILHLRESTTQYGLVPWRQATYKRACEQGWAPAPTNEFQKAIWEKVKADKERGPTNPIKIEPPKKK